MSQLASIDRSIARLISVEYEGSELLPVTPAEAKSYARVDGDAEDSTIDILIAESVEAFQSFTGARLFHQSVTATFQSEGFAILILPTGPVVSIESVERDGDSVEFGWKGDRLLVDEYGAIEVTFTAGLFEEAVPDSEKTGFLKWITSNFNDREDTAGLS